MKENSLSLLEKSCLEDSGSFVETYDVKLSVLNKGKLDLRIKFTDGKPEVVSVKVDEQKVATFDILCLHRYKAITIDSLYQKTSMHYDNYYSL